MGGDIKTDLKTYGNSPLSYRTLALWGRCPKKGTEEIFHNRRFSVEKKCRKDGVKRTANICKTERNSNIYNDYIIASLERIPELNYAIS